MVDEYTALGIARKFIWLGDRDEASAHFVLEPGCAYPSRSISAQLLRDWYQSGKVMFIPDSETEAPARDAVLTVQDGIITGADLWAHLDKKLKVN